MQIFGESRAEVDYARTAMAEWSILLLLVPAIVVPVVLLVGFTGCSFEPRGGPPTIISAVGTSISIITLTWHWGAVAQKFEFERTNPDNTTTTFETSGYASPYPDGGLAPATSYAYRVRGISLDGDTSDWSTSVTGTTLPH